MLWLATSSQPDSYLLHKLKVPFCVLSCMVARLKLPSARPRHTSSPCNSFLYYIPPPFSSHDTTLCYTPGVEERMDNAGMGAPMTKKCPCLLRASSTSR